MNERIKDKIKEIYLKIRKENDPLRTKFYSPARGRAVY